MVVHKDVVLHEVYPSYLGTEFQAADVCIQVVVQMRRFQVSATKI